MTRSERDNVGIELECNIMFCLLGGGSIGVGVFVLWRSWSRVQTRYGCRIAFPAPESCVFVSASAQVRKWAILEVNVRYSPYGVATLFPSIELV